MSQPGDGNFNDANLSNSSGDGGVSGGSQQPPKPTDSTNWKAEYDKLKASYDGLKGHATQMKTERDKLVLQLNDAQQTIESQKLDFEAQLATLTKTSTEAASTIEALQGKVGKFEREESLRATIRESHPDLLSDYEDGLLRLDNLEGDAITDYLTRYAERMSAVQTDAIKGTIKGATPPAPRGSDSAAKTPEELRQEVMKAAPGSDEYRTAWASYKQALAESKG